MIRSGLTKGILIAELLAGTVAAPSLAQHRDGPQAHRDTRQVVKSRQQAAKSRQVVKYREVTRSRGHKWQKGQRLAANQRRYVVSDWNQRGLRTPPRGYQWVRENNNSGDFLLVAAATGLIASILSQ